MAKSPWFSKAFGAFYTEVYAHRDDNEARQHLPAISKLANLRDQPSSILDLGCGQGRYSHLLQNQGHHVVGLDYSLELLNIAHQNYPELYLCKGNMLTLPFKNKFDRVLSLFTSFGYFEKDEENIRVLQQIYQSLIPHGYLYLDFLNAKLVQACDWTEKQLGTYSQISRKIIHKEQNRVEKQIRLYRNDKLKYEYSEFVKLYNFSWFEQQAQSTGFKLLNTFGNYLGETYDENSSPRLILLLQKT